MSLHLFFEPCVFSATKAERCGLSPDFRWSGGAARNSKAFATSLRAKRPRPSMKRLAAVVQKLRWLERPVRPSAPQLVQ